eukprot:574396-Pyramimonas_sp.AAC.1
MRSSTYYTRTGPCTVPRLDSRQAPLQRRAVHSLSALRGRETMQRTVPGLRIHDSSVVDVNAVRCIQVVRGP